MEGRADKCCFSYPCGMAVEESSHSCFDEHSIKKGHSKVDEVYAACIPYIYILSHNIYCFFGYGLCSLINL